MSARGEAGPDQGEMPGWQAKTGSTVFGLVLFAVFLPAGAATQERCAEEGLDASVSPELLAGEDDRETLALGFSLDYQRESADTRPRFPRVSFLCVDVNGTAPFTRIRVPQNLEGSLRFGASFSLSERAPPDPDADLDAAESYLFDYGVLGLGGHGAYESDTELDEQAVVGGGELRWVNPNWPILPSIVVTLDAVLPTRSEARDTLRLGKDIHGRLTVRGYWLIPLPARLELELDAGWFRAFGLEEVLEAQGWDEGPYLAGELGLDVGWAVGPTVLDELFVGYAWGQHATAGEERKAWTLGLEVGTR